MQSADNSHFNTHTLQPDNWIRLYADALYAYAVARVQDSAVAEDLVQETFLSAWRARAQYNASASEKTWLYAICKNKIIDHFRRQAAGPLVVDGADEDSYFDAGGHWKPGAAPQPWRIEASTAIETKEFYVVLANCRKKLKAIQQMVFAMKYMEDAATEEICKQLNITASNYWVTIHRVKLHLRKCLEKNWMGNS
jgi:RNA polymerase sigma-70 factor (TIGR02943 family)